MTAMTVVVETKVTVEIPDGYKYTAIDQDGKIWAYKFLPVQHDESNEWDLPPDEYHRHNCKLIGDTGGIVLAWQETLTSVQPRPPAQTTSSVAYRPCTL